MGVEQASLLIISMQEVEGQDMTRSQMMILMRRRKEGVLHSTSQSKSFNSRAGQSS